MINDDPTEREAEYAWRKHQEKKIEFNNRPQARESTELFALMWDYKYKEAFELSQSGDPVAKEMVVTQSTAPTGVKNAYSGILHFVHMVYDIQRESKHRKSILLHSLHTCNPLASLWPWPGRSVCVPCRTSSHRLVAKCSAPRPIGIVGKPSSVHLRAQRVPHAPSAKGT